MKNFKIDELSYKIGKFDQDSYLIARGVRHLGSHQFTKDEYKKVNKHLKEIIKSEKLKMFLDDSENNLTEIIIYHPKKGNELLSKLQKLDKKKDKYTKNKEAENLFEKIINKQKLTLSEKRLLSKVNKETKSLDKEYAKIFGYKV